MASVWIERESSEKMCTLLRRGNGRIKLRYGLSAHYTHQQLMTIERERKRWKDMMEEFRVRLLQAVLPVLPLVLQNEDLITELRIRCLYIDHDLIGDPEELNDYLIARPRFLKRYQKFRQQDAPGPRKPPSRGPG